MHIDKIWYLYILKCKDGTLYTGITTDVNRRVKEHNNSTKGAKYTRTRRPVKLLGFYKAGYCRSEAMSEEFRVKKLSRKDKKLLIESDNPDSKLYKPTKKRRRRRRRIFKKS